MTYRFLFSAVALGSALLAQTPPGDPLTFNLRLPDTLPLRLNDPIDLRKPQLSFSGSVTQVREPITRVEPLKSTVKTSPIDGMPIATPDPTVAHAMPIVPPKPGIDYKIATIPETKKAEVAAAAPEQR